MDNIQYQLDDLLLHKQIFLTVARKVANYYYSIGDSCTAIEITRRACLHDNSKIRPSEFNALTKLSCNRADMKNFSIEHSEAEKELISRHWKNNRHHPEHFNDVTDMEDIDILEMVCDWYSRSLQYESSFMGFVESKQKTRFHFPPEIYDKVLSYCNVLTSLDISL